MAAPTAPSSQTNSKGRPAAADSIEQALRDRLAAARARWPAIELADSAFGEHVAARAPADPASISSLHLEDLFLACACARGDRGAHAILEAQVLSQVPRWVKSFDGIRAEDVQQDLRQRLLLGPEAHLLKYKGTGPLDRWVQVAASRCAIDRSRRTKIPDRNAIEVLLAGPDPQIDFVKLHDRDALRGILRDALNSLPSRELRLLRFHYMESLSLDRMAELERVHRTTIARWLVSARATALERVHALVRERLRVSQQEGESLLRMVRSRLDLSLRTAFHA